MTGTRDPLPRRLATAAEASSTLDSLARLISPASGALRAHAKVYATLRGRQLGHAAHPLLTDLPIGLWVSSTTLDLLGPRDDGRAADRLLGLGILAAAPAALTGLADWHGEGQPVRRVGALHAILNAGALTMFASSWVLRRRDRRSLGVAVSLAASAVVGASGYLGGHMVLVQRSPHDDESTVEPDGR